MATGLYPPGTNLAWPVLCAVWVIVIGVVLFLTRKRIAGFLLQRTRAEAPDEERLRNFRKATVFLSAFAADLGIIGLVVCFGPPDLDFPVIAGGMFIAVICNLSYAYLFQSNGLKQFGWTLRKK